MRAPILPKKCQKRTKPSLRIGLFTEVNGKNIMDKTRRNQLITFILAITGIVLLYLGTDLHMPTLVLSSFIILVIGFIFMIITSAHAAKLWH
ncbi:hypothetical protein A3K78_00035 [Candidatus Bathyarchaeota archaeon RBG_13_52_12]|nr:MAG: hypothetical protein A3K78_00035 [Candidatus Bathyarchaeota archaeon RBG_13_52_12]